MGLTKLFNKPEYFHTPSAVIKKIFRPNLSNQLFTTRWQTKIMADWQDAIGGSIGLFGIYDLATTELLWRLIQPGNFVLDIGANIGYMTGLCSYRAGKTGKIWAFEPNPMLLERLRGNIARMSFDNVKLYEIGLSDKKGSAKLVIPHSYHKNAGIAYIAGENETDNHQTVEIELQSLDAVIPVGTVVDIMKIDVEGHELSVFSGATSLLSRKKVKHIVFEDLQAYPSAASAMLEGFGYKIFRIAKTLNRIKLEDPLSPPAYISKTTNYIATLDEQVVVRAVSDPGYKCLKSSSAS